MRQHENGFLKHDATNEQPTAASQHNVAPVPQGDARQQLRHSAEVEKEPLPHIESALSYERMCGRFANTLAGLVLAVGIMLCAFTAASAKIIPVTSTADTIAVDGVITLREAMTAANKNVASGDAPAGDPGVDTIKFQIPGVGVHTIVLSAPLPNVASDPIIIDGTSQTGYAGTPVIELNGNNVSGDGLYIQAGNSTVKGLVINRFNGSGIVLTNGGGNTIVNNYIGTNVAGTADLGNSGDGIDIHNSSGNNVIGGSGANRNVISGNDGAGIFIMSTSGAGNIIQRNFIGTNAAGTAAIGNNSSGVLVNSDSNTIGMPGLGNVISGNYRGVSFGPNADGNFVWGNFIGTSFDGMAGLGNAQEGILVGGSNNQIGGIAAGMQNVVSGNAAGGIGIYGNNANGNSVQGNLIGVKANGSVALGNSSVGVSVLDGNNNQIGGTAPAQRNVISGNTYGVGLGGTATGNTIQGNYIGVDLSGNVKLANTADGINIGASGNLIGGTAAGAGNIISGNDLNGIVLNKSNSNQVQGNRIGTNAAGTVALGNGSYGIRIIESSSNTIGGTNANARNLISGNGRGVSIENANSKDNLVQGNYIGVDVSGAVAMGNNGSGVAISGVNNTVGGTVAGAGNVLSGNASNGVSVTGAADGNKIQGNFIGTNASGTAKLGNTSEGIRIIDASNTLIGGTVPAARNIISGNNRGVTIEGTGSQNIIKGNYIGTDVTGTLALGNNQEGVSVTSSGNVIGGPGGGNLISANGDGVRISGPKAFNNLVQSNLIGTKADGSTALPNKAIGVITFLSSKNIIGGFSAGEGNTIAENGYAGVVIGFGVSNTVRRNSIFNNARLGIELDGQDALGLNANDLGDPDAGANWLQNYPLITSVTSSGGNTQVNGTLNSLPNKQFVIEFFSNTACDASGFGEGKTFFGSDTVMTDANGNATFNATFPVVLAGQYVTATATSPDNDTSEFSPCALAGGPNPGQLQFASSFFLTEEALGLAHITVTRSNGMSGTVSVNYATSDSTATNPADYTSTSGTLTFADGEVIKTFTIPINPDALAEGQETVGLTLSAPTGGAVLGANTSALYINDTDLTQPGVSFSDASVIEGDSGTTNMVFTISLTPHTVPVTVSYETISGLATTPDDYQSVSGQLLFAPGENSKQVLVAVKGDTKKEGDEMFYLELTGISPGYYIKAPGTGVIIDDESSKFQFDSGTYSANENSGQVTITVTRTGDTSIASSVNYATSDGTGKAGQDYTSAAGTLSFAVGETTRSFVINLADDANFEGDETVALTLSNPSAGWQLGNPSAATLTIVDNEQPPVPAPGSFAFVSSSYVISETGGQAMITVSRTGGSSGAVSVDYSVPNGGTAAPGVDFAPVTGTLSWIDGDSADKTFAVAIADDSLNEENETVGIRLSNPLGGASISNNETVLTITDNDPQPVLSIASVTQAEGNAASSDFVFSVALSSASGQTVTVDYQTANGAATAGNDYQPTSGTLIFAPGETAKAIAVAVNGDKQDEPDETFFVNLSQPTHATMGQAQGTGKIVNDDLPPSPGRLQFSSASYTVSENAGQALITVKRSGGSDGAVSVQYAAVAGGTATSGADYTAASGTLSWADGETADKTFTIPVAEDSLNEPGETFNIDLSKPTGGASFDSPSSALVTITDNDPQPAVSITDASQSEGNSGATNFTFDVTLSAASGQAITVDYLSVNGSAVSGSDFQATGGTLTFAAGETSKTIVVAVNGDTDVEPDETFSVSLSNPVSTTLGKSQGTGTIVNDDSKAGPTIQFSQAAYSVQEDLGFVNVTVTRNGDLSGPASVDYETVDGSGKQKTDFEYAAGTLSFAAGENNKTITLLINEDSYLEGNEQFSVKLSNPAGAGLGQQSQTSISISDDSPESLPNPIDDAQTFVYTHYHDFLNREPDAAGLAFWTDQIASCGNDAQCIEVKRINVSGAFFLSIEFQQTGYLRYLLEKESFGSMPKYTEFMRDVQEVSRGIIVNAPGWEQKVQQNQQQFAEAWIQRPAFKAIYDGMSNTDYVTALYANAGIPATPAEKQSLVNALDSASESRSAVLLDVAANAVFRQKEQNAAFVMMQYFGYLRRDPNSAPDSDLSGYNFWLAKLNSFGGDFKQAEMVKAFLISLEYRQRFGQ